MDTSLRLSSISNDNILFCVDMHHYRLVRYFLNNSESGDRQEIIDSALSSFVDLQISNSLPVGFKPSCNYFGVASNPLDWVTDKKFPKWIDGVEYSETQPIRSSYQVSLPLGEMTKDLIYNFVLSLPNEKDMNSAMMTLFRYIAFLRVQRVRNEPVYFCTRMTKEEIIKERRRGKAFEYYVHNIFDIYGFPFSSIQ